MKLLTLNTHSLVGEDNERRLAELVEAVAKELPEVIALQEVNQTAAAKPVTGKLRGYVQCEKGVTVRADNYVYRAVELLRKKGADYWWTWLPVKRGYDRYDEGVALLSRSRILETDVVQVSEIEDYDNWKTRRIVGARTEALPDEWFYSVHFGRWDDAEEPFRQQWIRTAIHMTKHDHAWLMGDFNAPALVTGEGYELMTRSYWQDSYTLAEKKDDGITVEDTIDGWSDKGAGGMRIDQIWCNKKAVVTSSEVIFNGKKYPVVSDHYGVMINYERSIV